MPEPGRELPFHRHLIPSHPIPVPRRDGTGPGRDILVLAVSLFISHIDLAREV